MPHPLAVLWLTAFGLLLAQPATDRAADPSGRHESAGRRAYFGINEDPVYNFPVARLPQFAEMLAKSGAGAVRMPIRWCVVEPQRGHWEFSAIDRALAVIPPKTEILAMLMSVPTWANGIDPQKAEGWSDAYPPKDIGDWERYVTTTVSRYRGRIRYWEVWNEENGVDFYRPRPDVPGYLRLLQAAYRAANQADHQCVVVLGGLQMNGIVPNPWSPVKTRNFIEDLYRAGARPYFDVCNIHPYVLPEEGAQRMMTLIGGTLSVMTKYGDARKPLWVTEVGCGANSHDAEAAQARLLADTFAATQKEPRIERIFWFLLRDMDRNLLGPEGSMGLFSFQGREKPALDVYRRAAAGAR
jgi:polysaccharide biosynthesis protein PslG